MKPCREKYIVFSFVYTNKIETNDDDDDDDEEKTFSILNFIKELDSALLLLSIDPQLFNDNIMLK